MRRPGITLGAVYGIVKVSTDAIKNDMNRVNRLPKMSKIKPPKKVPIIAPGNPTRTNRLETVPSSLSFTPKNSGSRKRKIV